MTPERHGGCVHDLGDMINGLTGQIVDAFVEVHRSLGPGFKEQHYQEALAYEFSQRGLVFEEQVRVTVRYKENVLSRPLRLDFVVVSKVVVELKAVEQLMPVHRAQLIR